MNRKQLKAKLAKRKFHQKVSAGNEKSFIECDAILNERGAQYINLGKWSRSPLKAGDIVHIMKLPSQYPGSVLAYHPEFAGHSGDYDMSDITLHAKYESRLLFIQDEHLCASGT